jgi:hypothetical protein
LRSLFLITHSVRDMAGLCKRCVGLTVPFTFRNYDVHWSQRFDCEPIAGFLLAWSAGAGRAESTKNEQRKDTSFVCAVRPKSKSRWFCDGPILDRDPSARVLFSLHGWTGRFG